MEPFTIPVTSITKREYIQACRRLALRLYSTLAVAMVIICGCILITSSQITIFALLAPVAIYLAVILITEILMQVLYKGQLNQIAELEYEFGPLQWAVIAQGERAEFKWSVTPKLVKTKDCLFLYNDVNRSSMVPRRLLTARQEEQILAWYQKARPLAKAKVAERQREERSRQKATAAERRRNWFGPAWGPLKNHEKKDK